MRQHVEFHNYVDGDGNPAGGFAVGTGIEITWQNGPLGSGEDRLEPNGAFVEDLIALCIERIRFYQTGGVETPPGGIEHRGRFACRENALALTHLEEALLWLDKRTRDRQARGVEGTHTA